MIKLILIVTLAGGGTSHNNLHLVGSFETMRECQVAAKENRTILSPSKGQRFIYMCARQI